MSKQSSIAGPVFALVLLSPWGLTYAGDAAAGEAIAKQQCVAW